MSLENIRKVEIKYMTYVGDRNVRGPECPQKK